MRARASCLAVLLALSCGEKQQRDTTQLETGDGADSQGSEGESESESESETGMEPGVVLSFLMADLVSGAAVPGAEACVVDHPEFPCVVGDENGAVEIEVPIDEEVIIRFTKEPGHVTSNEHALHLEDQSLTRYTLVTETSLMLFRGLLEIEAVAGTGTIIGIASPGVSVSLEPDVGFGPIYLDDTLLPNLDLTETTGNGGWAFTNVPPGAYEVAFAAAGQTCTGVGSWSSAAPSSHAITVRDGEISTSGLITCE